MTIRLGGYAKKFVPVRLAASKSFALAIIAVVWLVATALFDTANSRNTDYWSGWNNPWTLLAIVWSALGPGALVAFLQSQVQRCALLVVTAACVTQLILRYTMFAGASCGAICAESSHLLYCASLVSCSCFSVHA